MSTVPILKTISCIDDDEDILAIVDMALQLDGDLEVSTYQSALEALETLPRTVPDLILLDVMMPEMDGQQVLESLRQRPTLVATPVIFMTARVQAQEVERYHALGVAGVISKPFDPITLSGDIRRIWSEAYGRH